MPDSKFDLGDYVEVKDRIKLFYELYAQGRLVTEWAEVWEHGEKVRVVCKALAYRTPDDPLPAAGFSWMEVPGNTTYTRGSELENTETSAWGRAIAALGILVDRSVASANEVRAKAGEVDLHPPKVPDHADGLIGTVERGKPPVDLSLREGKDGPAWGFKLRNGRRSYQVLAQGPLAAALGVAVQGDDLIDQRVEVWGSIDMIPWDKDGKKMPPFARVNLTRIKTPAFTLPAEIADEPPVPEQAVLDAEIDALFPDAA